LVADQDKFVRQALVRLAHLSQIDCLFCDAEPPPALRRLLQESEVECVLAP
jgi:DeoR family glycerol-3-phosphate regulon repressor